MDQIDLFVADISGVGGLRPVTGGAGLARGAAPRGSAFILREESGAAVPCQAEVLAEWPDGSVRWVLLDFQASPTINAKKRYRLDWSGSGSHPTPEVPVHAEAGRTFCLRSGAVKIGPAKDALFGVSDRFDLALTAVDGEGKSCVAIADSVAIEKSGEMRSTLRLSGSLRTQSGERFLGFKMWVSMYAGMDQVQIEPMLLVDGEKGLIQKVKELKLELRPRKPVGRAVIAGTPDWKGEPSGKVRLFQIDDQQYRLEGADGNGSKSAGWIEVTSGGHTAAVAVRDFWQQWPKSIEVDSHSIGIGLFPSFKAGSFDHMMDPWYKHDYLFEGDCYRLRTGQTRRWQIWLDLSGEGASLAACANYPLALSADPAEAMATGLWGDILPAGAPGMAEYDKWAANLFAAYESSIATSRDYGAMNWGDWFGERGCNWGNHEYDTPRQFLVQFARTGDAKCFHTGEIAARHMSEVDVVHFINPDLKKYFETETPFRPGAITEPGLVHEHSVGHVGGFYSVEKVRELYVSLGVGGTDKPYLCLDPYNLGHVFTEGMMYAYFLTGDPWIKETLHKIGDHLARLVEERKFQFKGHAHCGRENGWSMLALAACHEVDGNPRYLAAMKTLADDALEEQDPNCGGWLYPLPLGHCNCKTRKHVGEATFISAIRLNGLYRYWKLSGDERVPRAIRRCVTHWTHDTWTESGRGWRYTSCPQTYNSVSQHGVTIQAVTGSVHATGDEGHLEILRKAWACLFEKLQATSPSGRGVGKTLSSQLYGCPETASLLAEKSASGRKASPEA